MALDTSSNETVLDRVLLAKYESDLANFQPAAVVSEILQTLGQREREVLQGRFQLGGHSEKTLEEIGQQFQVTRERVRQIENAALKRLRTTAGPTVDSVIKPVERLASQVLSEHGGVMHEERLMAHLLQTPGDTAENRTALFFLLSTFLAEQLEYLRPNRAYHAAWRLPTTSWELFEEVIEFLHQLLSEIGQPLTEEEFLERIQGHEFYQAKASHLKSPALLSYLQVSRRAGRNPFGQWGLTDWATIRPRRMGDKIFLILQRAGQPQHFTRIAELINQTHFDHKQAYPATVHNELILDDRFVLVGRGTYALQEWGYQPGVVADVISSVLAKAGQPLPREEIIEQVLQQRLVKRSTVVLSLMDRGRFHKLEDGRYGLVVG